MLNRLTNILEESAGDRSAGERLWRVDHRPGLRLVWLFATILFALSGIGGRVIYVQAFLDEELGRVFTRKTTTRKIIPSRDGRILAADGRVLAYDVQRFDVQMHYRWLEEPANRRWLERKALSRLDRDERRNRRRVAAAENAARRRRRAMWRRLAELAGISQEELTRSRRRIQRRIERMIQNVTERRRRRQSQPASSTEKLNPDAPWWRQAWQAVRLTLLTPPIPEPVDPFIAREELQYHTLLEDVGFEVASEIEAHPGRYPGLRIEVSTQRVYPQGALAAHVIGVRTPLRGADLQERRRQFPDGDPLGYRLGERIGRTGVERAYDRHLHGLHGLREVVHNERGEILRRRTVREPRRGGDVILTLNLPLQQRAEELLDEAIGIGRGDSGASQATQRVSHSDSVPDGGSAVVLDVHTGQVLVAASAPRFNVNVLAHPEPPQWRRLKDDPRRPFFHRATQMTLAPGSVFKVVTATALLENNRPAELPTFVCRGYLDPDHPKRYRCWIYRQYGFGHGELDLQHAIMQSCNVYFFKTGRRLGAEAILRWARRMGFGRRTGIDLPGEEAGNLPELPDQQSDGETVWYPGDTLGLAIGQSRLTVTPLQVARMMAAVANGGKLPVPRIIRGSGPRRADTMESRRIGSSVEPQRVPDLNRDTLHRLQAGLRQVVANRRGTAHKYVDVDEVAIAGKTGTAEVAGGKEDHAWFAGYVPAEAPRYAFAVVLEHGGSGGSTAGPVARGLVEAILEQNLLPLAKNE